MNKRQYIIPETCVYVLNPTAIIAYSGDEAYDAPGGDLSGDLTDDQESRQETDDRGSVWDNIW